MASLVEDDPRRAAFRVEFGTWLRGVQPALIEDELAGKDVERS